MEFTWHEPKRARNLRQHGLDFMDALRVFERLTFTFEHEIHIISFRKATKGEAQRYFREVAD
ncbi:MAG TPA: hypothetical protein PKA20_29695 [Burkholderiaceae bacterium]|nr:hypothetical protein [Burkholderiaceae bacterium]